MSHIKRMRAPSSWALARKEHTFVTRPKPGAHPFTEGFSIDTLLKLTMKRASTAKEVKKILVEGFLVDGKKRMETKLTVGLWDVIEFPKTKETYRIVLDKNGNLVATPIPASEKNVKLGKIVGKSRKGKKTQIFTNDGRSFLVEKDTYKTKDSIIYSVPEQKIQQHIEFAPGNLIYIRNGKYKGTIALLKEIKSTTIICETKKESFETAKEYAVVVGKDKALITVQAS